MKSQGRVQKKPWKGRAKGIYKAGIPLFPLGEKRGNNLINPERRTWNL